MILFLSKVSTIILTGFHVSRRELQDEPLHIRIMDYDTYSANDAIGKVYIVSYDDE